MDIPHPLKALAMLFLAMDASTAWQIVSSRMSGSYRDGFFSRVRPELCMRLDEEPLDVPNRRQLVLPRVQYTVPSQVIGWKGRPEYGENSSLWYDGEGLRNGPPVNFWRQNADEKGYRKSMEAVAAVLDSADESVLRQVESRMSIRYPMCNRKLFGEWLPLVVRGRRVGLMLDDDCGVAVPATITIKRVGGRKAKETTYLTQDLHMDDGEQLAMSLRSLIAENDQQIEATFTATTGKDRQRITFEEVADTTFDWILDSLCAIEFGNVSLLNEYLMVQRAASGDISDLYMRCDPKGSADQILVPEKVSSSKLKGLDGALDRSRRDRVEFREQFFEAIAGLKVDVPDVLVREPSWNYFSEDFVLIDQKGVSLKGLDPSKTLLKLVREFYSKLDTTPLKADFKVLSIVKIPRPPIKAQWSLEISGPDDLELRQKHLTHIPSTFELPLVILGNSTFSFDTEGKVSAMKLEWSMNGKELLFPQVPKDRSVMDTDNVENFAKNIFSLLSG